MPGQRNLFEYEFRMDKLSKKGDPLERLNEKIPWRKLFIKILKKAFRKQQKGPGGRPPYDYILMMKTLILQKFYNLSDEEMEYQLNDRLTFQRFIGVNISEDVPDATTIWLFRETLAKAGALEKLFDRFSRFLQEEGLKMNQGSIVDASFVEVPKQRNTREENKKMKEGKVPEDWNQSKKSQKDTDAKWTKRHGETHFGYKNHIKIDKKNKLIKQYEVTDASVHDSQVLNKLLDRNDRNHDLFGDSAYSGDPAAKQLKRRNIRNRIHKKGYRGHPMNETQKEKNRKKSSVRARVEHVFGYMVNTMKGGYIRSIGLMRAKANIGLMNLTYNLFCYERLARVRA